METREYRVRPVTRFVVTEFIEDGKDASSRSIGEYPNIAQATEIAQLYATQFPHATICDKRDDEAVYRTVGELIEALHGLPQEAIPFTPEPPFTGVRLIFQDNYEKCMIAPPRRGKDWFTETTSTAGPNPAKMTVTSTTAKPEDFIG